MHKLAIMRSAAMAEALVARLQEESIDATYVQEQHAASLYIGGSPTQAVFLLDKTHLDRATEILREIRAGQTSTKCRRCGHDLRGHAGPTACPECGHELTAELPDRPCPDCEEMVPGGFDVCWNCGSDLDAATE